MPIAGRPIVLTLFPFPLNEPRTSNEGLLSDGCPFRVAHHSFSGTSLANISTSARACYLNCKGNAACALYWYGASGSSDCRLFTSPLTGREETSLVHYNPAFLGGCGPDASAFFGLAWLT